MKKLALVAALALGLSACSTTEKQIMTKNDLVGEWICITKYDDLNTYTFDAILLAEDHTMIDNGVVNYYGISEKVPFSYTIESTGTWKLVNNKLIFLFDKEKVSRSTPKSVLEALSKDKELKRAKEVEQDLFDLLSNRENKKENKIELEILETSKVEFFAKQDMGERAYISRCSHPELFDARLQKAKSIMETKK